MITGFEELTQPLSDEEIKQQIKSLKQRAEHILFAAKGLENFLPEKQ